MTTKQPIGLLATCPQAIASVALQYACMDDMAEYADLSRSDRMDEDWRRYEAAQSKIELDDARSRLRSLFLRSMKSACAASTPKIPTTFSVNVAEEGESDRFERRVRMLPVTLVAYEMIETKGSADDYLHLLIASMDQLLIQRELQLQALATEYAESEAEALIEVGYEL